MILKIVTMGIFFCIVNSEPMDYKTIVEHLHLDYYNKDLAAPNSSFSLFKYNRTQLALNVSVWVLKDLDGNKIEHSTKLYAVLSNSFKFTGFQYNIRDVCNMWKSDLFGIRGILRKCGDIDLCYIKKGLWHLGNCWMNDSEKYFPKKVPQGSYKVSMETKMNDGTPLVTMSWYGKANLFFREMKGKQHL